MEIKSHVFRLDVEGLDELEAVFSSNLRAKNGAFCIAGERRGLQRTAKSCMAALQADSRIPADTVRSA
jgi:hypothetical protein